MASLKTTWSLARPFHLLPFVGIFMLMGPCCSSLAQAMKGSRPRELEFFVHESRAPPASILLVAPTTGPLTNVQFGSLLVFDNTVRTTASPNSTYIGRQLGTVAVGSDLSLFASFTYFLNTTSYVGSITVAGIIQTGKLVVTGGTDTFSFVHGIAFAQPVSDTPVAAVFKYNLELMYH